MKHRIIIFIISFIMPVVFIPHCSRRKPVNIVFISGAREYFSEISLKNYKQYLEKRYPEIRVKLLQATGPLNEKDEFSSLPDLESLDDCDVVLLFTRRITIEGEELNHLKTYIQSGRPLVAIRTASHGIQNWLEFDKQVLGGNYNGHYPGWYEVPTVNAEGNRFPDPKAMPEGPVQDVIINMDFKNHPVLNNIQNFTSDYSLYKTSPVADDVEVLMFGKIDGQQPEPSVWVRNYRGARIVYLALGGLRDWENDIFKQLVTNALFWASGSS